MLLALIYRYKVHPIDALDSERFVIAYRSNDGSNIGNAIIGNVSGTVISFGSPYSFHHACSDEIDVSTVTSKRFIIAYQDTSHSNFCMAKVGTSFGTNISFGLPYTVAITSLSWTHSAKKSSPTFIFFSNNTTTDFGTHLSEYFSQ
ncbi:hypothetical protein MHK_003820 [Candidatus Magnetomorum sp. HK-1]|nr:hypothetical protein MHK_003820 [Candidatus Magnetomorum sp. HK-1]